MKKIVILIMACLLVAGWKVAGYCQDEGGAGEGMADVGEADNSVIEQSESQISQGLDSEISSDQSQAEGEVDQVDSSMSVSGN